MKIWNIPVEWKMKATVQVRANTLYEAMELATKDNTNLPAGEYEPGSLDIYEDMMSSEIRADYNHDQPDEKPVEYISPAERERREEEERSWKRRLAIGYVFTALAAILIAAALAFMFWSDAQKSDAQQFQYQNASTSGTVIEKYTHEYKGTSFYVTVEHQSITEDGEPLTFTKDYRIPWEDYAQIEIGDIVHAQYTHFVDSGLWQYVSFEKAQE